MKSKFFGLLAVCGFLTLFWMAGKYTPTEALHTEDVAFLADSSEAPTATIETKPATDAKVNFANYVAYKRDCITEWMDSEIGLREKNNKNDHPRIDQYFTNLGWKNVKNLKAHTKAWCGAFIANAWLNCIEEIPWVKSNSSLAQVRTWKTGPSIPKSEAKKGDVISLATHSHVEGIYDRHPHPGFPFFTVVGGNTSAPPGDADRREGVHKKTRAWAEVNKVISLEQTLEMTLRQAQGDKEKHIS